MHREKAKVQQPLFAEKWTRRNGFKRRYYFYQNMIKDVLTFGENRAIIMPETLKRLTNHKIIKEERHMLANEMNHTVSKKNTIYRPAALAKYLIGVYHNVFVTSDDPYEEEAYQELEKNPDAKKLRCYMQIITALLRKDYGQKINEQLKGQMKKPAEIEELQHPVAELKKMGEEFWMPNADVMAYTKRANQRITVLLDSCVELFPQCIDKKYIRSFFTMPNGQTDKGITAARKFYLKNFSQCPYNYYVNFKFRAWDKNILASDRVFVKVLYEANGKEFREWSLLDSYEQKGPTQLCDYIAVADKEPIEMVVDSENMSYAAFRAMVEALSPANRQKIVKIILIKDANAENGWNYLMETVKIPVEVVQAKRYIKSKSMVDLYLMDSVKMEYEAGVRYFVVCSSDSDFLFMIEKTPDIHYYVALQSENVSPEAVKVLEDLNVPYDHIDKRYAREIDRIENFLPEEVFTNVLNRYVRKNVELGSDMAATLNGIYPRLTPSQTQNVMKHIHPYMTPDGCMEFRWEE